MSKEIDIKDLRFELIESELKGHKSVQVTFNYNGQERYYFIFIKEKKGTNYISEAKKQFEKDVRSGKAFKTKIINYRSWLVAGGSFLGVAALAIGGFFIWKSVTNKKVHVVTFESNGGSHIETKRVKDGETIAKPTDPTFVGHDFKGWYVTNPDPYPVSDEYDFNNKITSDITLYACWQETRATYYNFVFTGTNCTILNNAELTIPIKEGTTDVQFTILPNSGYALPTQRYISRDIQIEGANATYENGTITISEMTEKVSVNATLHHTNYSVSYVGNHCKGTQFGRSPSYSFQVAWNGEGEDFKIALNPDTNYSLPDEVSILFDGIKGNLNTDYTYSKTEKTLIIIKRANVSLSVTAITPDVFTVSFNANGGEVTSTNPVSVTDGGTILNAPTLADRPGYDKNAVTWYQEPTLTNKFDFGVSGTPVTTDMVLYAKWGDISQFTVNFYNDDGTKYESLQNIKVNYGDKVTYKDCPIESPYDNHYTFDGWYNKKPSETGAELFPFDTPLTGDPENSISIYAKHSKKKYHVTFDANGGEITSGGEPLDIAYNNSISVDKCPTASRSGFSDTTTWCTDKTGLNVFTFGATPITDNMTLYAKWEQPEPTTTYTVTLYAGDGLFATGRNTITLEVAENISIPKLVKSINVPTLTNDTFAYYTYADDSSIDYNHTVTSNLTLKAHYLGSATPLNDLDEISWKAIHDVAVTNVAPDNCFVLGASKHVSVYDHDHLLRIIGFNHDELSISTEENPLYAGITFEFFNVITKNNLCVTVRWQAAPTYVNHKYSTSTLRNFLNEGEDSILSELLNELQDEDLIKEVYRPVTEKQTAESDYEINASYKDKLFPLSYYEVMGESHGETLNEGTQYPYWEIHNTGDERKKYDVGGSTARGYWLRSPVINSTSEDFAWVIGTGGLPSDLNTVHYAGLPIAPAFCI